VVESSLGGKAWTGIDRKTNNTDFKAGSSTASFAVAKLAECRFIRLTQTGMNYVGYHYMTIYACEFFGTLLER
jgi:hypothetical protein